MLQPGVGVGHVSWLECRFAVAAHGCCRLLGKHDGKRNIKIMVYNGGNYTVSVSIIQTNRVEF